MELTFHSPVLRDFGSFQFNATSALHTVPLAGEYAARAAFWAFNVVSNYAYPRYNIVGAAVTAEVVATEKALMAAVATTDATAAGIVKAQGKY